MNDRSEKIIMEHWVIYRNPTDYPGNYVVRKWYIRTDGVRPDDKITVTDTIEQARAAIPPYLYCLKRSDEDVYCIVESWI